MDFIAWEGQGVAFQHSLNKGCVCAKGSAAAVLGSSAQPVTAAGFGEAQRSRRWQQGFSVPGCLALPPSPLPWTPSAWARPGEGRFHCTTSLSPCSKQIPSEHGCGWFWFPARISLWVESSSMTLACMV